jgi:polar amino acid transport system substrate-binding protein
MLRLFFTKSVFLLLACICVTEHFASESLPDVRVVTEEGYPINYTSETTGEVTGFATEFLRIVLDEAQVSYDIKSYSWTRAFKIAREEPNVLIYSMARTPEREDNFNWLFEIMTLNYFLYGASERANEFKSLDNSRDYKVAVVAGSVTQKYLEQDGYKNLVLAQDYEQLNNLVQRSRVDLIASSEFAIKSFINKFDYEQDYFTPYKPLNYVEIDLYYALSKDSDPRLVDKLLTLFQKNKQKLVIPR